MNKTETLTTVDAAGNPIIVVTLDEAAIRRYWSHFDRSHAERIHDCTRALADAITDGGASRNLPSIRSDGA